MFENMSSYEYLLWLFAVGGSTFFALKMFVSIVMGMDHDIEGDLSAGHIAHDGIGDSDASFQLLSLTSLSSGFMMFGWVGLAAYKEMGLGPTGSTLVAAVAAFLTMAAVGFLLSLSKKLTSSGADFSIDQAVGATGTVYQEIGTEKAGRVQVVVNGATHELDARADQELKSNTNIRVIEVIDHLTVRVEEVQ